MSRFRSKSESVYNNINNPSDAATSDTSAVAAAGSYPDNNQYYSGYPPNQSSQFYSQTASNYSMPHASGWSATSYRGSSSHRPASNSYRYPPQDFSNSYPPPPIYNSLSPKLDNHMPIKQEYATS